MAESSLFDEFAFLCDGRENPESLSGWCKQNGERGQLLLKEWDTERNKNGLGMSVDIGDVRYKDYRKAWWVCSRCGEPFEMSPRNRTLLGQGCYACGHKRGGEKNMDNALKEGRDLVSWCGRNGEFGQQLIKEWNNEKNFQNFGRKMEEFSAKSSKVVDWTCHRCGKDFSCMIYRRTEYKIGCPDCRSANTSYPEQFIYGVLRQAYPDAENRVKLFGGLEYDICIPSERVCVEYNGSYWHQNKKEKDELKRERCLENQYRYIGIFPIDNVKGEKRIWTENDCIYYEVDSKGIDRQLEEVAERLAAVLGQPDFQIDFQKARDYAARIMGGEKENNFTVKYPRLLEEWDWEGNGNINPKYFLAGSHKRVKWRCRHCGFVWENTIHSRIKFRSGCRNCGYNVFDNQIHKNARKRIKQNIRVGEFNL